MQRIILALSLLTIFFTSCESDLGSSSKTAKNGRPSIVGDTVFTYYPNGQVKTKKQFKKVPVEGSDSSKTMLSHGMTYLFKENGKLRSAIPYKDGKRHGEAKSFYENGEVYILETYNEGQLHGTKTKFTTSGTPMFIGYYEQGEHVKTSRLFELDGTEKPQPKLNIKIEDRRIKEGKVRLIIEPQGLKKLRKIKYYINMRSDDGTLFKFELDSKLGEAVQEIPVGPFQYYVRKLFISADYVLGTGERGGIVGKHNVALLPL